MKYSCYGVKQQINKIKTVVVDLLVKLKGVEWADCMGRLRPGAGQLQACRHMQVTRTHCVQPNPVRRPVERHLLHATGSGTSVC